MVRNYGTWIQNEGGMVSCMVPDVTIIWLSLLSREYPPKTYFLDHLSPRAEVP
jgi:hypothetical protein